LFGPENPHTASLLHYLCRCALSPGRHRGDDVLRERCEQSLKSSYRTGSERLTISVRRCGKIF
jgi:hypothetical protein